MSARSKSATYIRHRAKLHRRNKSHAVEREAPPKERTPKRDPGDRYGHAQERRAVHVFGFVDAVTPDWWVEIRQSSRADDAAGVDVWVSTDRGDVAVQVKSSLERASEWLASHPRWDGAVVVLSMRMTDEQVRRAVVRAVSVVRERRAGSMDGQKEAA